MRELPQIEIDDLSSELSSLARSVEPPEAKAQLYDSFFIGGFARSGKSLLSKRLSIECGFSIFRLDRMKGVSTANSPNVSAAFYRLLLSLHPKGLIIEGDNLFGENHSRGSIQSSEAFKNYIDVFAQMGVRFVFVGSASCSVEEKIKAMSEFRELNRCWTTEAMYGRDELRDLARRAISYSKELKGFAERHGQMFYDLHPATFQVDINSVHRSLLSAFI